MASSCDEAAPHQVKDVAHRAQCHPRSPHGGHPDGRSEPIPDDDRQRILVVEPDPTVRERMRRAIEQADGTVTEAGSLAEAQARLDDRIGSVIVDHQLPDGDGLDLVASVWATTPEAHVVVCSDGRADLRPGWLVHLPRSNVDTAVGALGFGGPVAAAGPILDTSPAALVGHWNRRCRTAPLGARQRHFTIVLADLDGLKQINDPDGHPTGDFTLQAFAVALRRSLRATDSAYRVGGDEFVLLLPETAQIGVPDAIARIKTSGARHSAGEPRLTRTTPTILHRFLLLPIADCSNNDEQTGTDTVPRTPAPRSRRPSRHGPPLPPSIRLLPRVASIRYRSDGPPDR